MKKILILVGKVGPKKELFTQIISKRAGKDIKASLGKFSHVTVKIGKGVKVFIDDIDIEEFDLVYFRRVDHSIFRNFGLMSGPFRSTILRHEI